MMTGVTPDARRLALCVALTLLVAGLALLAVIGG